MQQCARMKNWGVVCVHRSMHAAGEGYSPTRTKISAQIPPSWLKFGNYWMVIYSIQSLQQPNINPGGELFAKLHTAKPI